MLSNCYDLSFSNKLTERANNHRKIHASHSYVKQIKCKIFTSKFIRCANAEHAIGILV